jgi:hypothetical protein
MSLTQNDLYVFLNTGSSSAPFNGSETLQPDGNLGGGCISIGVADVNGDGLPDLLFGCTPPSPNATPTPANPAVGAIYLNNGTVSPFAGVAPVDIPATPQSNFATGVEAGVLVKDHAPNVLIVDAPTIGRRAIIRVQTVFSIRCGIALVPRRTRQASALLSNLGQLRRTTPPRFRPTQTS